MTTLSEPTSSTRVLHPPAYQVLPSALSLLAAKRQLATVRALADELEKALPRVADRSAIYEQLGQELARLARCLREAALIAGRLDAAAHPSGTRLSPWLDR